MIKFKVGYISLKGSFTKNKDQLKQMDLGTRDQETGTRDQETRNREQEPRTWDYCNRGPGNRDQETGTRNQGLLEPGTRDQEPGTIGNRN